MYTCIQRTKYMKDGQSNANTFPSQLILDVRQTNNLQTMNTVRQINRQTIRKTDRLLYLQIQYAESFLQKL